MADVFQRLIAKAGLRGECSADWNGKPAGRLAIRHSLGSALGEDFSDLSAPPQPATWAASISHTLDFGGWVAAPRPARAGFDIEIRSRLKLTLIARVSLPVELDRAPDPLYLWGAKEACFKACDPQPEVFTEIEIERWQKEDELWRFEARGGRGWVAEDAGRILTVYVG